MAISTSRVTEKPPGRRPIDTRTLPRSGSTSDRCGAPRARGGADFRICPLVGESEWSTGRRGAALRRTKQKLGPRVGLVHGRMKAAERDAAMAAFAGAGSISWWRRP